MTSASSHWEVGAVVLGYVGNVASWRRPKGDQAKRYGPTLVIQVGAETDDGAHSPAQSVTITSREGLIALRAAIDEALKEQQ